MPYTTLQVRACAFIAALTFMLPSLSADIVLDSGSFANTEASGGGFVVATSMFSLTSADIPDVLFEANFDIIDAGVEVVVNGTSLFTTGDDASNFGPQVFQPTAVQPDNIDFSFDPNDNGLPRLTVVSDSSGTVMTGAAFVNSTSTVPYIPLFNVANFTSLLQTGGNTIEIINHNNFQGATLNGDYRVKVVNAVPEPTSLSLCLIGSFFLMTRRRRQ